MQNLFHCFYFWLVFSRFARVLMGFLVCSIRWVLLGSYYGSYGKFVCVCVCVCVQTWLEKYLQCFFCLKNRKFCLRRRQWRRKEILGLCWETRRILDTGCWFTLGKVRSWTSCFKKCLLLVKILLNFFPSPTYQQVSF